ncbi:hypothetical protein ES703_68990 [subsurface metagenome]
MVGYCAQRDGQTAPGNESAALHLGKDRRLQPGSQLFGDSGHQLAYFDHSTKIQELNIITRAVVALVLAGEEEEHRLVFQVIGLVVTGTEAFIVVGQAK